MLSVKDIRERDNIKKEARKELFKKILGQVCTKIEFAYTLRQDQTIIEIPEFIFGYPAFNHTFATEYINRQLRNLGYRTSILGIGKIHVAWRAKKQSSGKRKPIEDEDANDLNSLANLKKTADALRKKYQSPK
jgi:hypothetical protein